MTSPPKRRVVITGLGPITCAGVGKDAFWRSIRAGKSGIGRITSFDTSELKATCGGEVRDWDPTAFFPPHRLKRLDRYAQFSVASTLLALDDAKLPWSREQPTARVGVSFGTALGGIANAEYEHQRFLKKGARGVNQTLALQVFGGSAHSNIAIECGFRGVGTTNSNSCASGVIAVGEALRYIRDGMADVIVAGAAEAPLSPLTFGAFDFIKTMSRWEGEPAALACRPFDAERDGFVMGEGAASLVLEEYEHAIRRAAPIYAEVLGYSLNNEAWHMTTPLPGGASIVCCMREALADAGLGPAEIDYINAHASSTQMNDANEAACIRQVFGARAARGDVSADSPPGDLPRRFAAPGSPRESTDPRSDGSQTRLAVSGTKPFTAHPLGATGAMETVLCALAVREGFIPPTLHHHTPDPGCDLDVVPNVGRAQPVRFAMNNAFGFGGINAVLVLGEAR
ncbi:MAG: beta-ketoacyl-[acyl-carrier-protein] synthase family protein [Verrucomicrobiota bacterium]|nr:beta-ketoacyl-[acyl-carrier-protein] synthase family protein [Verrucomicrobiota bacterium]